VKNQTLSTRTQGDAAHITIDASLDGFDWSGVDCVITLATSRTAAPLTTFSSAGGTNGTSIAVYPQPDGRVTVVADAEDTVTRRWPTTTLTLVVSFERANPAWGPYTMPAFYLPVVPQPYA